MSDGMAVRRVPEYTPEVGRDQWFDRLMLVREEFGVTVTMCFTPEGAGVIPHYTSPPSDPSQSADFCVSCAAMK